MVLYDKNHKFIGISSKTLSYLGYEDIKEFSSIHSDFANILVNKEGYIYNFSNFSWIDFILYSGSPNKSALITLKNGLEVEVKLSIEEISLPQPIENNSSFFAIDVTSEAEEIEEERYEHTAPKGIFNLDNLMQPADKQAIKLQTPDNELEKEQIETLNNNSYKLDVPETKPNKLNDKEFILDNYFENQNNINLEQDNPVVEPTKKIETPHVEDSKKVEEDFTLNFLKSEKEEEPVVEPTKNIETPHVEDSKKVEEDFTLNFLKSEKEEEPLVEPTKNIETPHVEDSKKVEEDFTLNFLKSEKEEEPVVEPTKNIETPHVEEKKSVEEDFTLNFLKSEKEEEPLVKPTKNIETHVEDSKSVEEDFTLNFLKSEKEEEPVVRSIQKIVTPPKEEEKKSVEEDFTLNFLKTEKEEKPLVEPTKNIETPNVQEKESIGEDFPLNFIKTEKEEEPVVRSIQKIVTPPKEEEKKNEEEDFALNFLRSNPYKTDSSESKNENKKDEPQEDTLQFNFLQNVNQEDRKPTIEEEQKEQLIDQIKKDIQEIDTKEETQTSLKSLSNSLKSIFSKGDKDDKKEETKNGFSLKSENKNITSQDVSSLENSSTTVVQHPSEKIESNLNLDLNKPLVQEKSSKTKSEIQAQKNISVNLQNLGLTKEDEYDLINDFVNDISVHLKLFYTLISNKNFDQAQYSLIKIKSSAEILNLDAIIISLNGIKEACDRKDELDIKELSFHLENQVQQLRDYLKNAII